MGKMWLRARTVMTLAVGAIALLPVNGFAWGSVGHALIGQVAAEQALVAKEFWKTNSNAVATLSNVPDAYWKQAPTVAREQTNHWFHIDAYMDPSVFIPDLFMNYGKTVQDHTRQSVTENGTSSWRSEQMFYMAIDAFQRKNFKAGLEVVGALSHYIGDMSQPLHLTLNHDGQLSNQQGIHKYFETTILQKANRDLLYSRVSSRVASLLASPQFREQLDGHEELKISYLEGMRAISQLESVLRIDREFGRNAQAATKQMEVAIERMSDGAATLAYLLGRIAQESNLQNRATQVKTEIPVWIPSEFQGLPAIAAPYGLADDCF